MVALIFCVCVCVCVCNHIIYLSLLLLHITVAAFLRDLWVFAGFENFHGSIDPEELFRKIFGDAGLGGMGGFGNFRDFEESKFGFAPASEVGSVREFVHALLSLCKFELSLLLEKILVTNNLCM